MHFESLTVPRVYFASTVLLSALGCSSEPPLPADAPIPLTGSDAASALNVDGVEPTAGDLLELAEGSEYPYTATLKVPQIDRDFFERSTKDAQPMPGHETKRHAPYIVLPVFRSNMSDTDGQSFAGQLQGSQPYFELGDDSSSPEFQNGRLRVEGVLRTPPVGEWTLELYLTPMAVLGLPPPARLQDGEGTRGDLALSREVRIVEKREPTIAE